MNNSIKICIIENCTKSIKARKLCTTHYEYYRWKNELIKFERPTTIRQDLVGTGFNFCTKCQTSKPISCFSKDKNTRTKLKNYCKSCIIDLNKQQRSKPISKNSRLKNLYNISLKDYENLLKIQNNKCAICNQNLVNDIHIDHDHKTNKVRGLVHSKCNLMLGLAKENLNILQGAINYIIEHQETMQFGMGILEDQTNDNITTLSDRSD